MAPCSTSLWESHDLRVIKTPETRESPCQYKPCFMSQFCTLYFKIMSLFEPFRLQNYHFYPQFYDMLFSFKPHCLPLSKRGYVFMSKSSTTLVNWSNAKSCTRKLSLCPDIQRVVNKDEMKKEIYRYHVIELFNNLSKSISK